MSFVVAREFDITMATEIAGEGVTRAPTRMHRAIGLEFSAPSTIIVECTTKKLDVVCDKEGRHFPGQVSEMIDGGIDFSNPIPKATSPKVREMITTKVSRVGRKPTTTVRN